MKSKASIKKQLSFRLFSNFKKYSEHECLKKNNLNIIDLFCGCGGFSLGFKKAGFNILSGIDNDKDALNTFFNNKIAESIKMDLSKDKNLKDLHQKLLSKNLDVIIAGPPCQGFSITGPKKLEDPRNRLYLAVIKLINLSKPKAFVIENVKGMKSLYNGEVIREILSRKELINYHVNFKILNAADYGVPQFRERVFIIGYLKDYKVENFFPEPRYFQDDYITCGEAISDLSDRNSEITGKEIDDYENSENLTSYQKLIRVNSDKLYNHTATIHTKHVIDVISKVPEGGNYKDLPEGVGSSRNFGCAWTRFNSNRPSNTIDTGHRNHFHYKFNRVPTMRENARLQSFPDNFFFTGNKTSQNRQIGNAVPPLLAKCIAEHVLNVIR